MMPILKESVVDIELKILVKLNWSIDYLSPISIIRGFLTLLLCPCSYQGYAKALDIFNNFILDEVSHLMKLAAVTYILQLCDQLSWINDCPRCIDFHY